MLKNQLQELNFLQKTVNILLLAASLIAPLKFGIMLLPGVPNGWSWNIWDLILNAFPPSFFALFAGVLLILTLIAYRVPENLTLKSYSGRWLIMWLLLPLAALIGFIHADSLESPVMELEYTLALAAMAGAAVVVLNSNGADYKNKLLLMICLGTMVTALRGAHQYFFGFEEMRLYLEAEEQKGAVIAPEIKARALDTRTYATFTFASALAGMFCLGGALTVVRAYLAGSRFEPVKVSQKLFGGIALLLCGGIFLTTRGRSAFLSVIVAAAVCGFIKLKSRKLKLALSAGALALIVLGACYIHYAGRGFGSMTERVGYLKSSWEMLVQHPLTGDGWGDFTFHHAAGKSFGNEELAKDPHNIVAAFAGQCGIVAGVLILCLMGFVLYGAYKNLQKDFSWERMALLFGLTAFSIHALMDLDWQVPALMFWYMLLGFAALRENHTDLPGTENSGRFLRYSFAGALVLTALCTAAGGVHWLRGDNAYSYFLRTAGQEPGTPQMPQSRFAVDKAAKKALALMPYSHSIYIAWGNDAMYRGDHATALERYSTAQKMIPRSHAIYQSMGNACRAAGDEATAAEYYRKADELFPLKKAIYDKRRQAQDAGLQQ